MPQNMEDSRNMSVRGEAKDITRREDNMGNKKYGSSFEIESNTNEESKN